MQELLTLRPETGAGAGRFAGYASVFGVTDSQNDIVERGAFAEAVALGGKKVKLLWQHDTKQPIGVLTHLKEDGLGLYVEGQLLLNLTQGREAYALLKAGQVTGLSIGFTPLRVRRDKQGVRRIQKVRLWEISLVTFPANASAGVTVVKHAPKRAPKHAPKPPSLRIPAPEAIRLSEALQRAQAMLS